MFCDQCLAIIDDNLSISDKFVLNIIKENGTSNKEDIVGLVKVLAKKENKEVITSRSGVGAILNKLDGALLINIENVGRQKLYTINKNGKQVLKGV